MQLAILITRLHLFVKFAIQTAKTVMGREMTSALNVTRQQSSAEPHVSVRLAFSPTLELIAVEPVILVA